MECKGFERINLCHITPCNGYGQMQNKSSLTDQRKYFCSFMLINIFVVANQRADNWPWTYRKGQTFTVNQI